MNKKTLRLSLAALAGLLVFASALGAASTWEGSAVIGGLEDFPSDDLFGACNSFPVNSSVEVENLENGKKVSVIISQTIDNPAVFMALSPKAAATLGMRRGAASRVRILAAPAVSTSAPRPAVAPGSSVDPDYNPSVLAYAKPSAEKGNSARGAELSGLLGPSSTGAGEEGASADVAAIAAPEEEPPVVALPETRVPEAPALVEPAPAVPAAGEKAVEAASPEPAAPAAVETAEGAAPEAIEAPAAEAAEVAAAEPEPSAEAAAESLPAEPAAVAAAEAADTAESAAPEPTEAAALAAAEPEAPAEPEAASAPTEAPAPAAAEPEAPAADVVLSLEPTTPRPPVADTSLALAAPASAADKPAPAAAAPIAPQPAAPVAAQPASMARAGHPAQDPAGVPRIEALAKGSYYVQIGVFATDEALKASVAALSSGKFPMAYERLEGRGPTAQYRLYVGPIARDESGLALKKIKAMGYGDAFLKRGK